MRCCRIVRYNSEMACSLLKGLWTSSIKRLFRQYPNNYLLNRVFLGKPVSIKVEWVFIIWLNDGYSKSYHLGNMSQLYSKFTCCYWHWNSQVLHTQHLVTSDFSSLAIARLLLSGCSCQGETYHWGIMISGPLQASLSFMKVILKKTFPG